MSFILDFPKSFSPCDVVLKNMLRDWRARKAESLGLPTYMVISNHAIDDIVFRKPQNRYDLNLVKGLGDAKIAKYGDEIISLSSSQ